MCSYWLWFCCIFAFGAVYLSCLVRIRREAAVLRKCLVRAEQRITAPEIGNDKNGVNMNQPANQWIYIRPELAEQLGIVKCSPNSPALSAGCVMLTEAAAQWGMCTSHVARQQRLLIRCDGAGEETGGRVHGHSMGDIEWRCEPGREVRAEEAKPRDGGRQACSVMPG